MVLKSIFVQAAIYAEQCCSLFNNCSFCVRPFSLDIDTYIHSTLHTMSVVSGGGGEVKLLVVAPL